MQKVLEDIGLNKNETLVYLDLLYRGEMIPSKISENIGLARTNVYAILKGLVRKEIIEEFERKKKLTYKVKHPQALLELMKEKRQREEESYKNLSLMVPKLVDEYEIVTGIPGASYLKGVDELRRVYEDISAVKKDVYVFGSKYARDKKEASAIMKEYIKEQSSLGIKAKVLMPRTSAKKTTDAKKDKNSLVETKYLPPAFLLYSQVIVYGRAIAITSFKKQIITTWIGDEDMAQTFRTIFMTLWDSEIGERVT